MGKCEDCIKYKDCKKPIGHIWGFCTVDFVEKEVKEDETNDNAPDTKNI